jgi:hypothetical protein
MTNNKDLNYVEQLKTQLNTPKTETRIILNDWQPEVKTSKLSAAARSKVVNHNKPYQSLSQEGYGPCHYSDCPQPSSVPFDLSFSIEGCKWWARNPGHGTSLPGYWKESPTGSYYYRDDLWLSHVGHAEDADDLIGPANLYTVNTIGDYTVEDNSFRRATREIIQECVKAHKEKGAPVDKLRVTLPSSTTRITQVTTATIAVIASIVALL